VGHQRIGTLPRSVPWRSIVQDLSTPVLSDKAVEELAQQTLSLVRSRFRRIEADSGVRTAFAFLVALSISGKGGDVAQAITRSLGVALPADRSALAIVRAARDLVSARADSLEYGEIAKSAVGDAIAAWHTRERTQPDLFVSSQESSALWSRASTGAGFCELSRLFFARFTERYLNYFLERAASDQTRSIAERDRLMSRLHSHIDRISQHAFETARITQSFAAGWFNRHANVPGLTDADVHGFLAIAFGKLRDELLRESQVP